MLDFTISQAKLSEAVTQLTKARSTESHELVDLICSPDSVRFVVTGRDFSCDAQVASVGAAQIPIAILPRVRKAAATFDGDIRIRIEDGRLKVNSMSLAMPEIALKRLAGRLIDIPDDAPARDVLALHYLFTDTEIAESNLVGRVLEANSILQKALDQSTDLREFGVTREQLSLLVQENLKVNAEVLRKVVLPPQI